MFRYRKQLTIGLVALLILSLAASLFSSVLSTGTDQADPLPCEQSSARMVQSLIQNQAFAFRSQNVSAAYGYFSQNFQKDVDKERFSLIVGTNYPMLLTGGTFAFGECRVIDIGFAQAVTLAADQVTHRLLYFISDADGPIKVEGITVER